MRVTVRATRVMQASVRAMRVTLRATRFMRFMRARQRAMRVAVLTGEMVK